MASGGGTYVVQNKVLPGAYVNFVSMARSQGTMGERGIVAMPLNLNWGLSEEAFEISSEDFQTNSMAILGYDYSADEMLPFREVFRGAKSILCYRISDGTRAQATLGALTATAKHKGTRGNDLSVVITAIAGQDSFSVETILDGIVVDEQLAATVGDLVDSNYITFSGTATDSLASNAGTALSGATDTEAVGSSYQSFLSAVEVCEFTTLIYAGSDATTKALFESFTKRLRDDEGYKITCVLHNYTSADYEGIISVKNAPELVYWVGGMTAGAQVNESLTNKLYDGEYSFSTAYTKSQLKAAIASGEFCFYGNKDGARVLRDINCFTDFTVDKNSDFANNQVVRVLDAIANDIAGIFDNYYLGKVQNDDIGRSFFRSEIVDYHRELEGIRAINSFDEASLVVEAGTEAGDVVVSECVEPVGAMEKLYMTCIIA